MSKRQEPVYDQGAAAAPFGGRSFAALARLVHGLAYGQIGEAARLRHECGTEDNTGRCMRKNSARLTIPPSAIAFGAGKPSAFVALLRTRSKCGHSCAMGPRPCSAPAVCPRPLGSAPTEASTGVMRHSARAQLPCGRAPIPLWQTEADTNHSGGAVVEASEVCAPRERAQPRKAKTMRIVRAVHNRASKEKWLDGLPCRLDEAARPKGRRWSAKRVTRRVLWAVLRARVRKQNAPQETISRETAIQREFSMVDPYAKQAWRRGLGLP